MSASANPEERKQLEQEAGYQDGCTPIREEEFERLPDYVIALIAQADKGELTPCTHEELTALTATYFTNSVTAEPDSAGAGASVQPVVEVASELQHECAAGGDPVAAGKVPASKQ
jgi:hypothetical protein